MKIAWGKKLSLEFIDKAIEVCNYLEMEVNHLMACMAFETGETFAPDKRNPISGATGLIQFMPTTAVKLGTTTTKLAAMTDIEQLDYVKQYFDWKKGKLKTLSDVYMTILWPRAVGKPEDYVLFESPSITYEQNKDLDINGDGIITKEEATHFVQEKYNIGMTSGYCLEIGKETPSFPTSPSSYTIETLVARLDSLEEKIKEMNIRVFGVNTKVSLLEERIIKLENRTGRVVWGD